jgi:hypothetical protein
MLQHQMSKPLALIKEEARGSPSFNSCGSHDTSTHQLHYHPTIHQPSSTPYLMQHDGGGGLVLPAQQLAKLLSGNQMELEQFAQLCACADDEEDEGEDSGSQLHHTQGHRLSSGMPLGTSAW